MAEVSRAELKFGEKLPAMLVKLEISRICYADGHKGHQTHGNTNCPGSCADMIKAAKMQTNC
jgi:hypothetical protein